MLSPQHSVIGHPATSPSNRSHSGLLGSTAVLPSAEPPRRVAFANTSPESNATTLVPCRLGRDVNSRTYTATCARVAASGWMPSRSQTRKYPTRPHACASMVRGTRVKSIPISSHPIANRGDREPATSLRPRHRVAGFLTTSLLMNCVDRHDGRSPAGRVDRSLWVP
jgi:hypothetical protein